MQDDIVIEKENKQVSIQLSPHSQVVILITFRLKQMRNLSVDISQQ
jgi:hypothetical protein